MATTVLNLQMVTMTVEGLSDVGILRLEMDRLVFAGSVMTRVVEFHSIMLLGTRDVLGSPVAAACSVNSSDYDATMLFWREDPLEYHIAAWYSRWLEGSGSTTVAPAMMELPPPTR
jgi:hypothetical protein